MFDPEFSNVVNGLAASKAYLNSERSDNEYKNSCVKKLKDALRYFYYDSVKDKILDIIYDDAYKLIYKSENDIYPVFAKDGDVEAKVDLIDENSIHGYMIKRIAIEDNFNSSNLEYVKNDVTRDYKFYDDSIMVNLLINGREYTKVARVNEEGIIEYAVFENTPNSKYFLLRSDEYNIKDVIEVFVKQNNCSDIKNLFPEIYERSPRFFPQRTRK